MRQRGRRIQEGESGRGGGWSDENRRNEKVKRGEKREAE